MIKANELRIGNWVYANTIRMEVCIAAEGIYEVEQNPNDYEPIPLTPEILEKAGFKNNRFESDYSYEDNSMSITRTDAGWIFFSDIATQLKYVHQLQNLYFALTGEELTINL